LMRVASVTSQRRMSPIFDYSWYPNCGGATRSRGTGVEPAHAIMTEHPRSYPRSIARLTARWCRGSTSAFGAEIPGSIPGRAATPYSSLLATGAFQMEPRKVSGTPVMGTYRTSAILEPKPGPPHNTMRFRRQRPIGRAPRSDCASVLLSAPKSDQ
jgi:hypothetical protein